MDGLEPVTGEVSLAFARYTTYALVGPPPHLSRVAAVGPPA
jgi:hypothetical protein